MNADAKSYWARPGPWINLALLVAMLAALPLIQHWRQGQFAGYGLRAVYWDGTDFKGNVIRRAVEPQIDFSDTTHKHFDRARFSVEWTGTIVLPRKGRYTFATTSDDGSSVELDGKIIVHNMGVHSLRKRTGFRIMKPGPHAIKVRYFQVGAGAVMRLHWTPAGRRGGLEVVPGTLLFPDPPETGRYSPAWPIPPRDYPAMLLLLGTWLAGVLLLLRGPLRAGMKQLARDPAARLDLLAFVLLFGAGLAMRLWDLSAAGRTWDEDVYWTAGRDFVQNLLAGDWRPESWAWNNEHPAMAKWIYGPATLIAESFTPPRALSAILGALTCALTFLAGRDLVNRRVGLVGAGLCLVLPHLVAHHKIIGLETPSGLFYTLTVWLFFRSLRRRGNSGYHLAAALCAGMLVATRISNLSVFLVLVVLYLVVHRKTIRAEARFPMPVTLGLAPVVVVLTFFVLWPYLWENPMKHIGEMLSHWEPDRFLEWYLGSKQRPNWYYFPLYFAVTTPVGVLAAVGLGLVGLALRRTLGNLALLVWFLAPFIVMVSPLARDGVRYLIPALLPACLLAAAGLDLLAGWGARLLRNERVRLPLVSVLGTVLVLYTFRAGSTVHPYYLDYYNELTGGPAEVAKKHMFEIAWWGEGLQEACDYISREARTGASVMVYAHPTHVVKLRDDLQRVDQFSQADYIINNVLFNPRPKTKDHHVTYVVRAAGAPLVYIYKRNEEQAPGDAPQEIP
jgi:4-amino-4-deoxy-L-arabinose transferase-like glycosyltransferase